MDRRRRRRRRRGETSFRRHDDKGVRLSVMGGRGDPAAREGAQTVVDGGIKVRGVGGGEYARKGLRSGAGCRAGAEISA